MTMESPQELRERLMTLADTTKGEHLLIEQIYQLSRIAFRLIDLENQLVTIGEILEDKQ